jgi:hypothetical protein
MPKGPSEGHAEVQVVHKHRPLEPALHRKLYGPRLAFEHEIGGVVQTPEEDHRAALEELGFKLKRDLRL